MAKLARDRPGRSIGRASMDDNMPCRAVTAAEIAHYREYGWTKLEAFVDPGLTRLLLDIGNAKLGADGDSNPPLPVLQEFFNHASADALADPRLRPLLDHLGSN